MLQHAIVLGGRFRHHTYPIRHSRIIEGSYQSSAQVNSAQNSYERSALRVSNSWDEVPLALGGIDLRGGVLPPWDAQPNKTLRFVSQSHGVIWGCLLFSSSTVVHRSGAMRMGCAVTSWARLGNGFTGLELRQLYYVRFSNFSVFLTFSENHKFITLVLFGALAVFMPFKKKKTLWFYLCIFIYEESVCSCSVKASWHSGHFWHRCCCICLFWKY